MRDGTSSCVLAFVNAPPHFSPILIIQPWIVAKTVEEAHNHPHFGRFWTDVKPIADHTHIAETLVDFSHAADDFLVRRVLRSVAHLSRMPVLRRRQMPWRSSSPCRWRWSRAPLTTGEPSPSRQKKVRRPACRR